jgi:hypothetical protein
MIVAGSLVTTSPGAQALLWLLYLGLFAGGLRAIWSQRRLVVLAAILAAIFLASLGTDLEMASRAWTLATASAGLLFFSLLIAVLLRDVMTEREVSLDTVFGASCVYLLLGMAWAMLYLIVETVSPGSFRLETATGGTDEARDLLYFSYVTLATVGYGDVTPLARPARALAALEGIIGQLYVAVTIARLVALHTQRAAARRDDS